MNGYNFVRQTKGLNPFLPFDTYIPDGEPKVFGGRVYLYGSFDKFGEGYCSREYRVFSAPADDLTDWTDHGVSFTSDDVPWSDALLYAPDALFHNGKYYLFFCMSDGSEGVAESDCPAGPFRNVQRITLDGEPIDGIDPSVLEYEGHVYYTWGQFEMRMGEMKDDLCSLKPETVRSGVLSNAPGREGFHEGSSLRRLGGRFCIIYASEYKDELPNSGARPTKLDYAVSDDPYGPYKRRGTVIDNTGCDPSTWNNHGSVIQIGDEWFVFYHASTNNSAFSRRARAERLSVDTENAVILQAYPSTNGFVKTLLPCHVTSPVNAYRFFGGAFLTQTEDHRFPVIIPDSAGFAFSLIHFDKCRYKLTINAQADSDAVISVNVGGLPAAEIQVPQSDDYVKAVCEFDASEQKAELEFSVRLSQGSCRIDDISIVSADVI